MSDDPDDLVPAPLWRRTAAAFYDGLLLLGLWMATLLLSLPLRSLFGMAPGSAGLRGLLFVVGLGFFGWFWTRGGQTLGMRSWRLQVRRRGGGALRWPPAILRYGVMLLYWGITLTPLAVVIITRFPSLAKSLPHATQAAVATATVIVLSIVAFGLDKSRRLPHDWIADTEVLLLARNPAALP